MESKKQSSQLNKKKAAADNARANTPATANTEAAPTVTAPITSTIYIPSLQENGSIFNENDQRAPHSSCPNNAFYYKHRQETFHNLSNVNYNVNNFHYQTKRHFNEWKNKNDYINRNAALAQHNTNNFNANRDYSNLIPINLHKTVDNKKQKYQELIETTTKPTEGVFSYPAYIKKPRGRPRKTNEKPAYDIPNKGAVYFATTLNLDKSPKKLPDTKTKGINTSILSLEYKKNFNNYYNEFETSIENSMLIDKNNKSNKLNDNHQILNANTSIPTDTISDNSSQKSFNEQQSSLTLCSPKNIENISKNLIYSNELPLKNLTFEEVTNTDNLNVNKNAKNNINIDTDIVPTNELIIKQELISNVNDTTDTLNTNQLILGDAVKDLNIAKPSTVSLVPLYQLMRHDLLKTNVLEEMVTPLSSSYNVIDNTKKQNNQENNYVSLQMNRRLTNRERSISDSTDSKAIYDEILKMDKETLKYCISNETGTLFDNALVTESHKYNTNVIRKVLNDIIKLESHDNMVVFMQKIKDCFGLEIEETANNDISINTENNAINTQENNNELINESQNTMNNEEIEIEIHAEDNNNNNIIKDQADVFQVNKTKDNKDDKEETELKTKENCDDIIKAQLEVTPIDSLSTTNEKNQIPALNTENLEVNEENNEKLKKQHEPTSTNRNNNLMQIPALNTENLEVNEENNKKLREQPEPTSTNRNNNLMQSIRTTQEFQFPEKNSLTNLQNDKDFNITTANEQNTKKIEEIQPKPQRIQYRRSLLSNKKDDHNISSNMINLQNSVTLNEKYSRNIPKEILTSSDSLTSIEKNVSRPSTNNYNKTNTMKSYENSAESRKNDNSKTSLDFTYSRYRNSSNHRYSRYREKYNSTILSNNTKNSHSKERYDSTTSPRTERNLPIQQRLIYNNSTSSIDEHNIPKSCLDNDTKNSEVSNSNSTTKISPMTNSYNALTNKFESSDICNGDGGSSIIIIDSSSSSSTSSSTSTTSSSSSESSSDTETDNVNKSIKKATNEDIEFVLKNFEQRILPTIPKDFHKRYKIKYKNSLENQLYFVVCIVTSRILNPNFLRKDVAKLKKLIKSKNNAKGIVKLKNILIALLNQKNNECGAQKRKIDNVANDAGNDEQPKVKKIRSEKVEKGNETQNIEKIQKNESNENLNEMNTEYNSDIKILDEGQSLDFVIPAVDHSISNKNISIAENPNEYTIKIIQNEMKNRTSDTNAIKESVQKSNETNQQMDWEMEQNTQNVEQLAQIQNEDEDTSQVPEMLQQQQKQQQQQQQQQEEEEENKQRLLKYIYNKICIIGKTTCNIINQQMLTDQLLKELADCKIKAGNQLLALEEGKIHLMTKAENIRNNTGDQTFEIPDNSLINSSNQNSINELFRTFISRINSNFFENTSPDHENSNINSRTNNTNVLPDDDILLINDFNAELSTTQTKENDEHTENINNKYTNFFKNKCQIKHIAFFAKSLIISCDEGNLYKLSLEEYKIINFSQKSIGNINDMVVYEDNKSLFTICAAGFLKKFNLENFQTEILIQFKEALECIDINAASIFIGGKNGGIYKFDKSIETSNISKLPWLNVRHPVTAIKSTILNNETVLIVAVNGKLIIYLLKNDGKSWSICVNAEYGVINKMFQIDKHFYFCTKDPKTQLNRLYPYETYEFRVDDQECVRRLRHLKDVVTFKAYNHKIVYLACNDGCIYFMDKLLHDITEPFYIKEKNMECLEINNNQIVIGLRNKELKIMELPHSIIIKLQKFTGEGET